MGRAKYQTGAALVELAIVLPLLALIAFGTFDYGRNLHLQQEATRILYEGLRYVSSSEQLAVRSTPDGAPWVERKYSLIKTACMADENSSECAKEHWQAMKRIVQLLNYTYGSSVTVDEIIIDYNIVGNTDGVNGSPGDGDLCARTVRGELKYSSSGISLFRPLLSGQTKGLVPYFFIGENEEGVRCKKA